MLQQIIRLEAEDTGGIVLYRKNREGLAKKITFELGPERREWPNFEVITIKLLIMKWFVQLEVNYIKCDNVGILQ